MKLLTRTEEMILLAVIHLGDNAYGVTVRNYLRDIARQNLSIGGVYIPLDRLVGKRLLKSYQGDPTPERGGMSKRFYKITPKGVAMLHETNRVHDLMWQGVPDLGLSNGRS